MTPETANGRGAIPLVTDGTLPVDLAPQPPGPRGHVSTYVIVFAGAVAVSDYRTYVSARSHCLGQMF